MDAMMVAMSPCTCMLAGWWPRVLPITTVWMRSRMMMAGKSKRSTLKGVFAEHQSIIDALRAKDKIAFSYHMDRHLSAGLVFTPNATVSRDSKSK